MEWFWYYCSFWYCRRKICHLRWQHCSLRLYWNNFSREVYCSDSRRYSSSHLRWCSRRRIGHLHRSWNWNRILLWYWCRECQICRNRNWNSFLLWCGSREIHYGSTRRNIPPHIQWNRCSSWTYFCCGDNKGNSTSVWGTQSPTDRLYSTLWYRQKYRYRNWYYSQTWKFSWRIRQSWYCYFEICSKIYWWSWCWNRRGSSLQRQGIIGRTNAPIFTDGTIYILGVHTAAQGISSGRETGLVESFTPGTIFGGPGQVTFKGIAPSRPIQVFGYYGDDKDPGTSGVISITPSQEGIEIRSLKDYVGVGTAYFSGAYSDLSATFREIGTGELFKFSALYERRTFDYVGSGTLTASGTTDAPSTFQTPDNTVLFTVSGEAQKRAALKDDMGGTISIYNTEKIVTGITLSIATEGTFSLFSSGAESIVIPSDTTTALFDIEGIADTREIQVYGYYGDDRDPGTSGTITIVGELTHPQIDFTPAETGFGDLTFVGESIVKVDLKIVGKGTLPLSGTATEKFVSGAGEDTILFSIDGDGETALNSVYGYYGDDKDPGTSGQATFSGIGDTRKITVYGYYGDDKDPGTSGTFTFSNTPLVHPEVDYTPHYTGRGVINFTGGVAVKRTFPEVVGSGSLFGFGTKDEAYARTTYVGIGVAGFFGAAFTETVAFEPSRVYVTII